MDRLVAEILSSQDQWYSLLEPLEDLQYCSVALADGNVRRICLGGHVRPAALMEEVCAFIEEKKARLEDLRYWAIHPGCRNRRLEAYFAWQGFKSNLEIAMALGPTVSLATNPCVEIQGGVEPPEEWRAVHIAKYQEDRDVESSDIPRLLEYNKSRFQDPRVQVYVAKLRGQPAGTMALFTSDQTAQIDEVYTMPKFRRQHVASTLMAALVDTAKQGGVRNIIIVVPKAFPSYNMYRKIGFFEKLQLPGYYR